jgi:hypothetical protein
MDGGTDGPIEVPCRRNTDCLNVDNIPCTVYVCINNICTYSTLDSNDTCATPSLCVIDSCAPLRSTTPDGCVHDPNPAFHCNQGVCQPTTGFCVECNVDTDCPVPSDCCNKAVCSFDKCEMTNLCPTSQCVRGVDQCTCR